MWHLPAVHLSVSVWHHRLDLCPNMPCQSMASYNNYHLLPVAARIFSGMLHWYKVRCALRRQLSCSHILTLFSLHSDKNIAYFFQIYIYIYLFHCRFNQVEKKFLWRQCIIIITVITLFLKGTLVIFNHSLYNFDKFPCRCTTPLLHYR